MSQTNTPALLPSAMQNLVMAPPAELMPTLAGNFAGAFEDYNTQFRSISLRGFQFTLKESGSSTVYPQPFLPAVILGMAPDRHCSWYAKKYSGDADDNVAPDAVWWEKMGAPASVPPQALQKDADGRNQYSIRQRIALAIIKQDVNTGGMFIDLDNPYILDVGAKSLFGKDYPDQFAFSLAGLIRFCARNRILPLQFAVQIIFDRTESVPAIRFVPTNNNGNVTFLDAATLESVYRVAAQPNIADMLKVRLRPEPNAALQTSQQVSAPQIAQTPAAAPAPMPQPVTTPQAAPAAAAPQPAPVTPPVMPQAAPAAVAPAPAATPDLMAAAAAASAAANAALSQPAAPVAPQAAPAATAAPAAPAAPQAASDTQNALQNLLARANSFGS